MAGVLLRSAPVLLPSIALIVLAGLRVALVIRALLDWDNASTIDLTATGRLTIVRKDGSKDSQGNKSQRKPRKS